MTRPGRDYAPWTPPDGFTTSIACYPAFDRRHPDPKQDYGIGGVKMRWVLKGPSGAITWGILTSWYLPETWYERASPEDVQTWGDGLRDPEHFHVPTGRRQTDREDRFLHLYCAPQPTGVDYHAAWPRDDDPSTANDCDVLPGGKCWSDESGLAGNAVFVRLLREGDPGVWDELLRYYARWISRCVPPEDERPTFGDHMRMLLALLEQRGATS